ncbi:SURF1 family protein [Brevundimonas vitis]|uniref:SURF1-like protein n=1 Tax=Brevundimonas vitisensis TaxID=2800818 RepID=A0ABX7BIZ2_9CAUL|nr:SURF1 family protein [Brevundimonas vitisensis]QQQ17509.1 SURF1 family protein [Brevundimonas vitisensis]
MTSEPTRRARFPWPLTLATGLALCLLIGLGSWQVQRLGWKQDIIARAEAAAGLPPAPIEDVLQEDAIEYRSVILTCPGLATAPFVELKTIHDGTSGVRLISACRADETLLVDRGFVADTVSARPPVRASTDPVRLTGQIRRTDRNRWAPPPQGGVFYDRDLAAMAAVLGMAAPVSDITIFATTSSNPDWPALQPSAPPAAFSNNHLGYAATWFGLALALVGFYVALLRRRRDPGKQPRSASAATGKMKS